MMPDTITLTIDSLETTASSEETILSAARRLGIDIPTLCYLEGKKGLESCDLCMVEVEGQPNVIPACASRVQPGMVIRTDTPALREGRRMALELLLSDHLGDCNAPCELACPADIDIPEFLRQIRDGHPLKSLEVILRSIAFPGVLGRICPKFCEDVCRRGALDEPIAICALKRYPADYEVESGEVLSIQRRPPTGKRIVIVGAGIVGLTAAYYLLLEGHDCLIYEATHRPGGALRNLIPEFRLPASVTEGEIERIVHLGAKIEYGKALGSGCSLAEIQQQCDAVLLAFGAALEKQPQFEGSKLGGSCAQLLQGVSLGNSPAVQGDVLVFGAGATALDSCRTLLRLGARSATLAMNSSLQAHYFFTPQIEDALAEGVQILEQTDLVRVERLPVGALRCCFKTAEREYSHEYSALYLSGHIEPDHALLESQGLKTTRQGVRVDRRTLMTSIPGVFAAGNIAQAGRYAVHGSAAGRTAAECIARYLEGHCAPGKEPIHVRMHPLAPEDRATLFSLFHKLDRASQGKLPPSVSAGSFREITEGCPEPEAVREAARCLQCDCAKKDNCLLRIHSTAFAANPKAFGGERPAYECDQSHAEIVYESGKCIKCGRCIAVAEEYGEELGLTYIGRGFRVKVGAPLNGALKDGLRKAALACAEVCPTAALARKR
jgi:formate dehydrogenase major subunit